MDFPPSPILPEHVYRRLLQADDRPGLPDRRHALPLPCLADVKSDFVNPPLKFRSRPLWFWNNTEVTAAEVEAQLQGNRDQSGYGGLAPLPFGAKFTPKYLSEEYFDLYGAAVKKARELGMFLTIYDEYGFPSGSCGANMGDGIPRFKNKYPDATLRRLDKHEDTVTGPGPYSKPLPAGTLMSLVAMNTATKERVDLTAKASGGSISWSVPAGSWKIMTFVCVLDGDPNVDYLEPDHVAKFIGMVYQPYYDRFAQGLRRHHRRRVLRRAHPVPRTRPHVDRPVQREVPGRLRVQPDAVLPGPVV